MRSRAAFPIAVLVAALLAAVAPAAAPAAVPRGFFGVMADGPVVDGRADLGTEQRLMRSAGVGSVRVAVEWATLQPNADQPPDLTPVDRFVAGAARAGLDVLPVVFRTPAWAAADPSNVASPPADPATYGRFLATLIARYGPHGTLWSEPGAPPRRPIRRWQVWNEPDITRYWSSPVPWPRGYVRLLRGARTAIKAADPKAKVVLAGLTNLSWVDLAKVYAAGAKGLFDIAAAHPFSKRVSSVVRIVELLRLAMRRAHDGKRRLLLTELSWTSAAGHAALVYGWETSEAGQARRVRSAVTRFARARKRFKLAGIFWYTWMSPAIGGTDSFSYSGLRRLDDAGRPVDKPAMAAFRTAVRRLER